MSNLFLYTRLPVCVYIVYFFIQHNAAVKISLTTIKTGEVNNIDHIVAKQRSARIPQVLACGCHLTAPPTHTEKLHLIRNGSRNETKSSNLRSQSNWALAGFAGTNPIHGGCTMDGTLLWLIEGQTQDLWGVLWCLAPRLWWQVLWILWAEWWGHLGLDLFP